MGIYEIGNDADTMKIRKTVGLLPENVGLYDELNAYDNLDFYGRLYERSEEPRKEGIGHFPKMLGLWEKRDLLAGTF